LASARAKPRVWEVYRCLIDGNRWPVGSGESSAKRLCPQCGNEGTSETVLARQEAMRRARGRRR